MYKRQPEGLWKIIRVFTGFYNIPIIVVVITGLFFKKVPAQAAKIAIIFHVVAYGILRFVWKVDIHFVHVYAILFFMELAIMLVIGKIYPTKNAWQYQSPTTDVDLTPWKYAYPASFTLLASIVILYLTFSKIGFAGGGIGTDYFFIVTGTIVLTALASWWSLRKQSMK